MAILWDIGHYNWSCWNFAVIIGIGIGIGIGSVVDVDLPQVLG